jgi:hypothetical protein
MFVIYQGKYVHNVKELGVPIVLIAGVGINEATL